MTTTTDPGTIETAVPDLTDIPVDQIKSGVLAASIALYRDRMRENGIPLSSFQARI